MSKQRTIENEVVADLAALIDEFAHVVVPKLYRYPEYHRPFLALLLGYLPQFILQGSNVDRFKYKFGKDLKKLLTPCLNEEEIEKLKESCAYLGLVVTMQPNFHYSVRRGLCEVEWIHPTTYKRHEINLRLLSREIALAIKTQLDTAIRAGEYLGRGAAGNSLASLFEHRQLKEIESRLKANKALASYTENGSNLLHLAVLNGCSALVPLFLKEGVSPTHPNRAHNTPIALAFMLDDLAAAQAMVATLSTVPQIGETYLTNFPNAKLCQYAAFYKRIDFIERQATSKTPLLNLGDLSFTDAGGNNILHYIASYAQAQEWEVIASLLLKHNRDAFFNLLGAANHQGYTPIMRAIKAKNTKLVKDLCQNYAPSQLVSESMYVTPVNLAQNTKDPDLLQIVSRHFGNQVCQPLLAGIADNTELIDVVSHSPVVSRCRAWWGQLLPARRDDRSATI